MRYLQATSPQEGERLLDILIRLFVNGPFRPSRRNGLSLHLRRDKPMFPSKLWNVHKSTLKGEDRTNNQVEGWNNRFASIVGHDHPDIWVLILKMRMELSVDETKLGQLSLGVSQVKRKRKFALQGRLQSLCIQYRDGHISVSDFLKADKALFTCSGMPRKCAVPGCKSNYKNSAYTNVFYFPKDEEAKRKWIRAIHRDDFVPSTESVVCIKHFDERFIQREDKVRRDDGTWLCVPKSKPKLTTDAIPTIFENQPSYMTTPAPSKRKTPAERLAEQSLRFEDEFRSYLDDDRIKSFDSVRLLS
ncbi:hypothetical protein JTE90_019203 [Oedothorax gibbosus]|uniref:THAP-type domain-containing protein n=1 Tax=Oedothorax gibbosus TaxID=931172 RepID=A0AAV6TTR5_9ARAC|nr:hypothetical protein JTE90_019203 [Oedothorax gibbosus]